MRKIVPLICAVVLLAGYLSLGADAATIVRINELIEHASQYDNTQIVVQGEAIGEPMERGDICWVNMHDGTNAIGIKIATIDAGLIKNYGNYQKTGDIIQVTGIFHSACSEDGGETDIHATGILVIKEGEPTHNPVSFVKILIAVGLAGLTGCCLIIFRKRHLI